MFISRLISSSSDEYWMRFSFYIYGCDIYIVCSDQWSIVMSCTKFGHQRKFSSYISRLWMWEKRFFENEKAISLFSNLASQCQNNPCGNRGTCVNTPSGFFRCINCALGYNGYFCELRKNEFVSFVDENHLFGLIFRISNGSIEFECYLYTWSSKCKQ